MRSPREYASFDDGSALKTTSEGQDPGLEGTRGLSRNKKETHSFRALQPAFLISGLMPSSLPSSNVPIVQITCDSLSASLVELKRSSPPSLHSPEGVAKMDDGRWASPWMARACVLRKASAR